MNDAPAEVPATRKAEIEVRTSATPEQAYAAWADPAHLARWFTDGAEGEAKPGGTVTWLFEKFNYRLPYSVLEARPGEQLTLQMDIPGRPPGILDVTIAQDGGETVIRLVNSGFLDGEQWDDEYEGAVSGWQLAFASLKLYLERHFGVDKVQALSMRPAVFEWNALRPLYTTNEGVSRWLTTRSSLNEQSASLCFDTQPPLNGRVLAISKREVLLEWPERNGVLGLKAFSGAKGKKTLCLHAILWGATKADAQSLEQWFDTKLNALATLLE
jgi:uncharacterized protein YndB with AHSA1/START domain